MYCRHTPSWNEGTEVLLSLILYNSSWQQASLPHNATHQTAATQSSVSSLPTVDEHATSSYSDLIDDTTGETSMPFVSIETIEPPQGLPVRYHARVHNRLLLALIPAACRSHLHYLLGHCQSSTSLAKQTAQF